MSKRREKIQREKAKRRTEKRKAMLRSDGESAFAEKKRLQRKGIFATASPLPRPEGLELSSLGSVRNTQ